VVARDRAAEQQRVHRRFGPSPATDRTTDCDEAGPVGVGCDRCERVVDGVAQVVVTVDHEQGEQVFTTADIAVDR